jgi:hypothetical protein
MKSLRHCGCGHTFTKLVSEYQSQYITHFRVSRKFIDSWRQGLEHESVLEGLYVPVEMGINTSNSRNIE